MHYSDIKYADMIDGEGIRVSVFVSGCSHGCKGCFNVDTWNPTFGEVFDESVQDEILNYFKKYGDNLQGLSLLGGDPTYPLNIEPLKEFVLKFKNIYSDKNIWIWSGYKWEYIYKNKKLLSLVSLCDVLVDGKFVEELKDLNLKYRGSSNQRIIDIQKSLKEEKLNFYKTLE